MRDIERLRRRLLVAMGLVGATQLAAAGCSEGAEAPVSGVTDTGSDDAAGLDTAGLDTATADSGADAQQAALDEVDHARRCFAVAQRIDGQARGPGPLSPGELGMDGDLTTAVVAAIHEGCVGETLAAGLASVHARAAEDDAVAAILR